MSALPAANRQKRRPVRVAVTASTARWRTAFIAHATEHDARVVATTVRDPDVLRSDPFDVLVVDDTTITSLPSPTRCAPSTVIGISTDGEEGRERLQRWGLAPDDVLEADAPDDIAAAVLHAATALGIEPIASRLHRAAMASTAASTAAPGATSEPVGSIRRTNLLAVAGPDPTLAAELATGVAAGFSSHAAVMLVDLDLDRPIAPRLGLGIQPNLCDAVHTLRALHDARLAPFVASRAITTVQLPFAPLVGAPSPQRQVELTNTERSAVLHRATEQYDVVVALADERRPTADLPGAALAHCGLALVVVEATPAALPALLDWLAALRSSTVDRTTDPVPVCVVTVGDVSRRRVESILDEIEDCTRDLAVGAVGHLRLSARAHARARWRGDLVRGSFARRCRALVEEVSA